MGALHRAWRVYADPATSKAVTGLRWMIPLDFASWLYRMFAPDDWPAWSGTTLVQVGLWCALLWVVRQRDEARSALKRASFEYKLHPAPGEGRIVEWRSRDT